MIARLGQLAVTHWLSLDGYAVAHGTNPSQEPIGRFCAFVYHMVTRNGDEKGIRKFDQNLWMPPKGVAPDRRSPWSPENETAAFQAVKAMTTGQAPSTPAPVPSMRARAETAQAQAKAAREAKAEAS